MTEPTIDLPTGHCYACATEAGLDPTLVGLCPLPDEVQGYCRDVRCLACGPTTVDAAGVCILHDHTGYEVKNDHGERFDPRNIRRLNRPEFIQAMTALRSTRAEFFLTIAQQESPCSTMESLLFYLAALASEHQEVSAIINAVRVAGGDMEVAARILGLSQEEIDKLVTKVDSGA